jgi:hypothetical protein
MERAKTSQDSTTHDNKTRVIKKRPSAKYEGPVLRKKLAHVKRTPFTLRRIRAKPASHDDTAPSASEIVHHMSDPRRRRMCLDNPGLASGSSFERTPLKLRRIRSKTALRYLHQQQVASAVAAVHAAEENRGLWPAGMVRGRVGWVPKGAGTTAAVVPAPTLPPGAVDAPDQLSPGVENPIQGAADKDNFATVTVHHGDNGHRSQRVG